MIRVAMQVRFELHGTPVTQSNQGPRRPLWMDLGKALRERAFRRITCLYNSSPRAV